MTKASQSLQWALWAVGCGISSQERATLLGEATCCYVVAMAQLEMGQPRCHCRHVQE